MWAGIAGNGAETLLDRAQVGSQTGKWQAKIVYKGPRDIDKIEDWKFVADVDKVWD